MRDTPPITSGSKVNATDCSQDIFWICQYSIVYFPLNDTLSIRSDKNWTSTHLYYQTLPSRNVATYIIGERRTEHGTRMTLCMLSYGLTLTDLWVSVTCWVPCSCPAPLQEAGPGTPWMCSKMDQGRKWHCCHCSRDSAAPYETTGSSPHSARKTPGWNGQGNHTV